MTNTGTFHVGNQAVFIESGEDVMPPSPYSLFLASHIPALPGATVADVGTGCGIQAIVAKYRGADVVYVTDTNRVALDVSVRNAGRNGFHSGVIPLHGSILDPLPADVMLDCVVCNPASLPMPEPEDDKSPYYSGPDGRSMIERVVRQAAARLRVGGTLLMVHTSLADWPATERLMFTCGFSPRIVDQVRLEFRPFYNRAWIESLNGLNRGLYILWEGQPIETLNLVVAEYLPGRRLVEASEAALVGIK